MAFTEAAEFARSIQIEAPEEDAAAAAAGTASVRPKAEEQSHMGVDDEEPAQAPLPAPKADPGPPAPAAAWGNWVSAEDGAARGPVQQPDVEMADVKEEDDKGDEGDVTAPPEDLITREKAVGKGAVARISCTKGPVGCREFCSEMLHARDLHGGVSEQPYWVLLHACLLISSGAVRAGLAGALALLKDRGELTEQVEWAGRTTDIIAAQRLVQARCCLLLSYCRLARQRAAGACSS